MIALGSREKHSDCGNKTGIGLVENEVTRRGNSPVEGSEEKKIRGVERKGRGLEEKSRQIFVPAWCKRCRQEKSANQEKLVR